MHLLAAAAAAAAAASATTSTFASATACASTSNAVVASCAECMLVDAATLPRPEPRLAQHQQHAQTRDRHLQRQQMHLLLQLHPNAMHFARLAPRLGHSRLRPHPRPPIHHHCLRLRLHLQPNHLPLPLPPRCRISSYLHLLHPPYPEQRLLLGGPLFPNISHLHTPSYRSLSLLQIEGFHLPTGRPSHTQHRQLHMDPMPATCPMYVLHHQAHRRYYAQSQALFRQWH